MRLNKEHFWRDRLYNYAIKSAAATFKRSTSFIRERYIVPVSSNFLKQISCGIKTKCRKTRAMQRDFTIVDSLALRVDSLALRAVRVKPISWALRACFLGHYRMARMSQSASSCGLASWMRPQQCNTSMIPDTHLLKLLFPTRYTSRSIRLVLWRALVYHRNI